MTDIHHNYTGKAIQKSSNIGKTCAKGTRSAVISSVDNIVDKIPAKIPTRTVIAAPIVAHIG